MSIKVFLHYNVDGVIVYGCLLLLNDDVKDGGGEESGFVFLLTLLVVFFSIFHNHIFVVLFDVAC